MTFQLSCTAVCTAAKCTNLECGPIPNVMAAQPNIGVAVCESPAIPFLVHCHKAWLTTGGRVPCSNAVNIRESKTWTQSEFCMWQNVGKSPQNAYIVYQRRRRRNILQSFVDHR